MKDTLYDRLLQVLSDGCWHPAEELVEEISHRFSATIHILRKRGYKIEMRSAGGQQREYRLVR